MTFRLFGRVARLSKRKGEKWQMTLRGTADSAEIFQSFFVLGSLSSAPDYIIGHWIGRMDQADHKGPDAGTWIWHKSKDLTVCALNEMVSDYSKEFPLCLTPGISNVLGKGKPVPPSILFGSGDITC